VVAYDPTIYQGAAAHYRDGRPAYSPELEALLTQELDLDGSAGLLDGAAAPGAAPGPYRVVTFGSSFHWTDEARVAEMVYDLLEPGGALALTVHTVEGPEPPSPGPPPIPHAEIKSLVVQFDHRDGRVTVPR
jgi:hypothetical protein